MNALVAGLAEVVDAAVDGEFSRRIELTLRDDDLRGVMTGVNNLVATVDRGLTETGAVLSELARTNLTHRVRGDYKGAFARLKTDTNAVGEKLTDIIGQLRTTGERFVSARPSL